MQDKVIKIPKSVEIGWKEFEVNSVKGDVVLGSQICYGDILFDDECINISTLYSEEQQSRTFLHECFHGLSDVYDINLSEKQVGKLGDAFYKFIKDNPEIFK